MIITVNHCCNWQHETENKYGNIVAQHFVISTVIRYCTGSPYTFVIIPGPTRKWYDTPKQSKEKTTK